MKTGTAEVKSEQKVVGSADYEIWDSTTEAIEDRGEEVVLGLINTQNKTNAMNALRQLHSSKPTKAALEAEAFSLCSLDELQAVAGDGAKYRSLLDSKLIEVKEKYGLNKDVSEDD